MNKDTTKILEKTAAYIDASQTELEDANAKLATTKTELKTLQTKLASHDEKRRRFVKRATQASGVLANRGIIEAYKVNEFVDKAAEDPNVVWGLVEKLASALSADSFTEGTLEKVSASSADPFERNFFGIGGLEDGMIE